MFVIIFKSIRIADDTFPRNPACEWVYVEHLGPQVTTKIWFHLSSKNILAVTLAIGTRLGLRLQYEYDERHKLYVNKFYFSVDITVFHGGYHGDLNETFFVGKIDEKSKKLVTVTYECLSQAMDAGRFLSISKLYLF